MHFAKLGIWEMIPAVFGISTVQAIPKSEQDLRAGVAIQHGWSLDELFAILAPLALVGIVRVADGLGVEVEELAQIILRKMPRSVFRLVHNARRQVLLLTSGKALDSHHHHTTKIDNLLSLEDFFLDCTGRLESVHKA